MKALNILGFQYIIRNYFNCKRVKFGVKMEKIEELLRDFGLTEYEIKAFVTLLKLKVATAEQISEVGNIPLPRVYDTLSELKNKGFVLISKTRPKRFKSKVYSFYTFGGCATSRNWVRVSLSIASGTEPTCR